MFLVGVESSRPASGSSSFDFTEGGMGGEKTSKQVGGDGLPTLLQDGGEDIPTLEGGEELLTLEGGGEELPTLLQDGGDGLPTLLQGGEEPSKAEQIGGEVGAAVKNVVVSFF